MNNPAYHVDTQHLITILTDGKSQLPLDMSRECYVNLPLARTYPKGTQFVPGVWRIVVRPSTITLIDTNQGNYKRLARMTHRILVECRCGKMVPTGRLHMHAAFCHKLTEE